jgi:signal transduction histidine kinase
MELKIGGITALFVVFILLDVYLTSAMLAQGQYDSAVINVAGRQRMYSQKMTKEAYAVARGQERPETLRATAATFERVLTGLLAGDAALKLPRQSDPGVVQTLREVEKQWHELRPHIDRVAADGGSVALNEIVARNLPLLATIDTAVAQLEWQAQVRLRRLRNAQLGILIASLALAAVAFTLVRMVIVGLLRKQDEAARTAIGARDDFVAIASHELRAPLATLLLQLEGLSEALRAARADPTLEDWVSRAKRQAKRLSGLVDRLLDASRISSGRLDLVWQKVDLVKVVQDVAQCFLEEATKHGSQICVRGVERAPGMWDRLRLEQVVTNLLSNAVKYGPGKPIEVDVEVEGPTARLHVRDHGVGIRPEDANRIFERFERAGASTTHTGGLGLGLYITRQVVEALGGRVLVDSEPGRGSLFTVELPITRPDMAARATALHGGQR